MQGRYGQDAFTRFLLGAMLACVVLNLLVGSRFLSIMAWALLVYAYFRLFFQKSRRTLCGESEISERNGKASVLV